MTEQIAILRQCRRCGDFRSINRFTGLGVVCRDCTGNGRPAKGAGPSRTYALTAKAREFLQHERYIALLRHV